MQHGSPANPPPNIAFSSLTTGGFSEVKTTWKKKNGVMSLFQKAFENPPPDPSQPFLSRCSMGPTFGQFIYVYMVNVVKYLGKWLYFTNLDFLKWMISLTKPPLGVRSCEVAIIWPEIYHTLSLWDHKNSYPIYTWKIERNISQKPWKFSKKIFLPPTNHHNGHNLNLPFLFSLQPLSPLLKVKLLVGYIRQIPLNSKGRLGNKAIT